MISNIPFHTRVTYPDPRTKEPRTGVIVGHDPTPHGDYVSVKRDGLAAWEQWDRVEVKAVKESK